jgi:hypothetical protein
LNSYSDGSLKDGTFGSADGELIDVLGFVLGDVVGSDGRWHAPGAKLFCSSSVPVCSSRTGGKCGVICVVAHPPIAWLAFW